MKESNAPFTIPDGWPRFALGYVVLWGSLLLIAEAGGGEFASALGVLIASGMTVYAIDAVTKNVRLDAKGGTQ